MATEFGRKRFHLEQIIEHISEECSLTNSATFPPSLIPEAIPDQVERRHALENRELNEQTFGGGSTATSEGTSDEDTSNEKEESIDVDGSTIPTKISPRCDVCGLLHFKSYRCLTRFAAPSYLRKMFDDTTEKLRVCRKCLASKENCVENVAMSSLASYSAQIRQMKIPLGMTGERRTRAFEFVVRDLKQLKSGRRCSENGDVDMFDHSASIESTPAQSPLQPTRKNMLQRFNVDDPIQKNLFLRELNLYSTDLMEQNTSPNDQDLSGSDVPAQDSSNEESQNHETKGKTVYHVAAKDVPSTNVSEKKIGEMFDARKGMNHDLVVHTKRAWKPNKKYDDLRKVERTKGKKDGKRGSKQGKSVSTKPKVEKDGDQPEKVRTCGINCAVCFKHVQKSYSCCTWQTAPERYKHLFTPGVTRLKICRKCIPYKKVAKVEPQNLLKKKTKIKQKRGRKPKFGKPGALVKAISVGGVTVQGDVVKKGLKGVMAGDRMFSSEPFAAVAARNAQEMVKEGNIVMTPSCDGQLYSPYTMP